MHPFKCHSALKHEPYNRVGETTLRRNPLYLSGSYSEDLYGIMFYQDVTMPTSMCLRVLMEIGFPSRPHLSRWRMVWSGRSGGRRGWLGFLAYASCWWPTHLSYLCTPPGNTHTQTRTSSVYHALHVCPADRRTHPAAVHAPSPTMQMRFMPIFIGGWISINLIDNLFEILIHVI